MFLRKSQKRRVDVEAVMNRTKTEKSLRLEKGDLPAIIIAAFAVFTPFLLVFTGALAFAYWLIVGRFS